MEIQFVKYSIMTISGSVWFNRWCSFTDLVDVRH